MPALTTEEFRQWADACPLLSRDDYRFAEVVIIIHQGAVVGCDVRLKHRYPATSPPKEAETATATNEPSVQ